MALKPYRRKGTGPDPAADFAEQIVRLPHMDAVLIQDLQTDGSTNTCLFPHGLGRCLKGAIVCGQDQTSVVLKVMSPRDMINNSIDPTKYVGVRAGSAVVVTLNLLVF